MYSGGATSTFEWHSHHTAQALRNNGVRLLLYPFGDVSVRWSTVGRIVLKAAVARRVMRRRDDDAVGEATLAPAIVVKNRVRDYRRWSVAMVSIDHDVDAICCQYLEALAKAGSESACVSMPM